MLKVPLEIKGKFFRDSLFSATRNAIRPVLGVVSDFRAKGAQG